MIRATCSTCGTDYKFGDDKAGLRARCKECGTAFVVKDSSASPALPPRADEQKRRRRKAERQRSQERQRSRKTTEVRAERYDRIHKIVTWTGWGLTACLPLIYYLISSKLHFYELEGDGSIVERARGGGLIDMRTVMPYGSAALFAASLFGTFTFVPLIVAPETWLRKSDRGRFWWDISSVSLTLTFRIVVFLIAAFFSAVLFVTLAAIVEGPYINSPPLSWALGF